MESNKKEQFSREDAVLRCRLAQQTEMYPEMLQQADKLCRLGGELTPGERNLISTCFKTVVGNRRAELRVLSALTASEESYPQNPQERAGNSLKYIQKYREMIQKELIDYCQKILKGVEEPIRNAKSMEMKIFFLKLQADYNRYLCQFKQDIELNRNRALASYQQAENLARNNLALTNPLRLGINLNMSVFYYEILGKRERAIQIANRAFEEAIASIDNVNQTDYKDCTLIIQLLRDNITLWSSGEYEDDS